MHLPHHPHLLLLHNRNLLSSATMHNYEAGDNSGGSYRGGTLLIGNMRAFHQYGLLMPPDFRLPKDWSISWGGLVVPPLPTGDEAFRHAILE